NQAEQGQHESSDQCRVQPQPEPGVFLQRPRFGHGQESRKTQRDDQQQTGESQNQSQDATDPATAKPAESMWCLQFLAQLHSGIMEPAHWRVISDLPFLIDLFLTQTIFRLFCIGKGVKPEAEFVTATDYKDDTDYEDDRGSAECRVRSAEWRTF